MVTRNCHPSNVLSGYSWHDCCAGAIYIYVVTTLDPHPAIGKANPEQQKAENMANLVKCEMQSQYCYYLHCAASKLVRLWVSQLG